MTEQDKEHMDNKNASATIVWTDEDNCHSYLVVLPEYGLKLLMAKDIDASSTEITVYGPADSVSQLLEDIAEDSIMPLDSMSASLEFDEDYESWLANEVCWQKQLMAYETA